MQTTTRCPALYTVQITSDSDGIKSTLTPHQGKSRAKAVAEYAAYAPRLKPGMTIALRQGDAVILAATKAVA